MGDMGRYKWDIIGDILDSAKVHARPGLLQISASGRAVASPPARAIAPQYELARQPGATGAGVFGFDDIFERLRAVRGTGSRSRRLADGPLALQKRIGREGRFRRRCENHVPLHCRKILKSAPTLLIGGIDRAANEPCEVFMVHSP